MLCWSWARAFGGVKVEGAVGAVLQQGLDSGEVVAHALAAGGGRGDYDVLADSEGADGGDLVGVEVGDAEGVEPGLEPGVEGRVEVGESGLSGRDLLEVDKLVLVPQEALEVSEEVGGVHVRARGSRFRSR